MHISETNLFIRGPSDDILQTDILAEANNFKKLDDMIKHTESFEAAVWDQIRLGNPSDVQAVRLSIYHRKKPQQPQTVKFLSLSHMPLALLSNVLDRIVVAKSTETGKVPLPAQHGLKPATSATKWTTLLESACTVKLLSGRSRILMKSFHESVFNSPPLFHTSGPAAHCTFRKTPTPNHNTLLLQSHSI